MRTTLTYVSYTSRLDAAWEAKDEERYNALFEEMTDHDKLIYAIEADDFLFANEVMNSNPYINLADDETSLGPLWHALDCRSYRIAAMLLDRSKQEWECHEDKWFLRALVRWVSGY